MGQDIAGCSVCLYFHGSVVSVHMIRLEVNVCRICISLPGLNTRGRRVSVTHLDWSELHGCTHTLLACNFESPGPSESVVFWIWQALATI